MLASRAATTAYVEALETVEHVFPYVRAKACVNHKLETVKYEYEMERTSTRTTKKTEGGKEETTKEEVTETVLKKVYLKQFTKGEDEDIDHFFEAFEHMLKQLQPVYATVTTNQNNDATELFKAMDTMLDRFANTLWHDAIVEQANTYKATTWKDYKGIVSYFIKKKLAKRDNAYVVQRHYLNERPLPRGVTVLDW